MTLKQPTGRVELAAGPKRKRVVFEVPSQAWLEANDITMPRVEDRIERWWRTDAAQPDPDRRFRGGLKVLWPDPWPDKAFIAAVLYDSPDERAAQGAKSVRFVPTGWDIDDYEGNHPTSPWAWMRAALSPDELVLVRKYKLFGPTALAMARRQSKQYVQRCYSGAITRAWYAAICQVREQSGERSGEQSWERPRELRDQADCGERAAAGAIAQARPVRARG
jgi:hypothetical protein